MCAFSAENMVNRRKHIAVIQCKNLKYSPKQYSRYFGNTLGDTILCKNLCTTPIYYAIFFVIDCVN